MAWAVCGLCVCRRSVHGTFDSAWLYRMLRMKRVGTKCKKIDIARSAREKDANAISPLIIIL